MKFQSGTFENWRDHIPARWFRFYKFREGGYELWLGNHWFSVEWGSK